MLFIAYDFKGQTHVFAGRVKIVSHSSCRTSAILKYFCPLLSSYVTSWICWGQAESIRRLLPGHSEIPENTLSLECALQINK